MGPHDFRKRTKLRVTRAAFQALFETGRAISMVHLERDERARTFVRPSWGG